MLRFIVSWEEPYSRGDASEATRGTMQVTLYSKPIWTNIWWTWIDLLDFLTVNWNRLLNEGALPADATEAQKYDFSISHDLAYALRGASPPPSIIITRKGHYLEVTTGDTTATVIIRDITTSLKYIGNLIARRVIHLSDDKTKAVLARWEALGGEVNPPQPSKPPTQVVSLPKKPLRKGRPARRRQP